MFYLKSHVIERINTLTLPFDFELHKFNKRIQVRTLKCSLILFYIKRSHIKTIKEIKNSVITSEINSKNHSVQNNYFFIIFKRTF